MRRHRRLARRPWFTRPSGVSFLVAALLIFVTAAYAHADGALRSCETALLDLVARVGKVRSNKFFGVPLRDSPTVSVTETRAGRHGGEILMLERHGAEWVSNHRTVSFDPQGDPRWFISVAGVETARFFGFKLIDSTHCEVPNAAEFNGALAELNERLRARGAEPVVLTFYQTPDNENVKVIDYVRHFRDSAGIPLAQSGNHLVHDLSFHTAAIFYPPEVVRFKQAEAKFIEAYIDWLSRKYAKDEGRAQAVRTFAFTWRTLETSSIDNGTGTLAPALVEVDQTTDRERRHELLTAPMNWMLSDGKSHTEAMDSLILDLDRDSRLTNLVGIPRDRRVRIARALDKLSLETLRSDLIRFVKEYDGQPWLYPDRFSKYADGASNDRLCTELTARRALIHDLVAEPASAKPSPAWTSRLWRFVGDNAHDSLEAMGF